MTLTPTPRYVTERSLLDRDNVALDRPITFSLGGQPFVAPSFPGVDFRGTSDRRRQLGRALEPGPPERFAVILRGFATDG